jgi:hypothetical protein
VRNFITRQATDSFRKTVLHGHSLLHQLKCKVPAGDSCRNVGLSSRSIKPTRNEREAVLYCSDVPVLTRLSIERILALLFPVLLWTSPISTEYSFMEPKRHKTKKKVGEDETFTCQICNTRQWQGPPLCSSGQSSWQQNGDVLWFLRGTNWIYICYVEDSRPPLWSSGQSSWLQIQTSRFDSRRYQIFWQVVDLEQGPQSFVSITEELLERKSNCSGLESREYGRRVPSRWPRGTLCPQKLALTSPTSGRRSIGQFARGPRPRSLI